MEHALKRGAPIYAELRGYGATADAFHLSSLAPGAEGSARSMKSSSGARRCRRDGGRISFRRSRHPHPEATARKQRRLPTTIADNEAHLHVSRVKSMTGTCSGGAGAMGALAAVLAIRDGIVPPTINLDNVDPAYAALRAELYAERGGQEARARGSREQFRFRWHECIRGLCAPLNRQVMNIDEIAFNRLIGLQREPAGGGFFGEPSGRSAVSQSPRDCACCGPTRGRGSGERRMGVTTFRRAFGRVYCGGAADGDRVSRSCPRKNSWQSRGHG